MDDIKSEAQFSTICRICAGPSDILNNLFSAREKSILLAEMVSQCAQIEIGENDERPSSICNKCIQNLVVAYEFQSLAKLSEEKFQKILLGDDEDTNHFDDDGFFCEDFAPAEPKQPDIVKIENPNFDFEVEVKLERLPEEQINNSKISQTKISKKVEKAKKSYPRRKRDPNTSYECYKCKVGLDSAKKVREHLRKHVAATPHECKICGMYFSIRFLNRHLCSGKSVQCEYCTKSLQTTKKLFEHLDTHQNRKLYKCVHCGVQFPMKLIVDWHMNKHYTTEKAFVCDVCNRRFVGISGLRKHQLNHVDTKSFFCHHCGAGFKCQSILNNHLIRHTVKSVACSQCPRRFHTVVDLRRHMDIHNNIKYVCSECGSSLSSKHSLAQHKRNVHLHAAVQTCEVCSKTFNTPYNLKRHMLTHTKEKPFKCQYCTRGFSQNAELNKHLRSHIGENTYACNICSQSFRLHIDLRKHSYEHFQNQMKDANKSETNK